MFRLAPTLVTLIAFAYLTPAEAGPASDAAQKRFDAIAEGKVDDVTSAYASGAVLQWVGGPLDGVYSNPAELKEVWAKFTKAQGPLKVTVAELAESANPKGTTVTANVVFTGQNTIKVRYALVYRADKLVNEVWQVDPNLKY